ncbi:stage V sporulation protein AE [Pradoshia eiseniae]|uniref:Stage V sporulation protein AE n=1 Tax=Pradoshia eiseniae TaxID=2064768 RepID=A0A2S7N460_9BACI|nr:stage V sporulation protein AE [Pradoshia eiseniae]PQD96862.1 stage V sporulation protein AE [Pradoshia eiseniae]
MEQKRNIIMITDGDEYAKRAVEHAAKEIGGRCISASYGNPAKVDGPELVRLIKSAANDPVLVMFDDSGLVGEGAGETTMRYVANHKDINILGIVAVASKTRQAEWTKVDICIDREGNLTERGVDKFGIPEMDIGRINGDTVYCIDSIHAPIVVGIGDIGKMGKFDDIKIGSPITLSAIKLILERSGYLDRN